MRLLAVTRDNVMRPFNAQDGKCNRLQRSCIIPGNWVTCMTTCKSCILTGSNDGSIVLWDLSYLNQDMDQDVCADIKRPLPGNQFKMFFPSHNMQAGFDISRRVVDSEWRLYQWTLPNGMAMQDGVLVDARLKSFETQEDESRTVETDAYEVPFQGHSMAVNCLTLGDGYLFTVSHPCLFCTDRTFTPFLSCKGFKGLYCSGVDHSRLNYWRFRRCHAGQSSDTICCLSGTHRIH